MSRHLYRLGRFAARRAWLVVITWLLVLGVAAAGAATLSKPFTSKLSIPGTEFQTVLDDLATALPATAGGNAPVLLTTTNGQPFTEAQEQAVAGLMARWKQLPGVASVTDPFVTQQQIESAATQLEQGRTQLEAGQKELATKKAELAAARTQVDQGRALLDAQAKALAANPDLAPAGAEQQLAAARAQLDAAQARIDSGSEQLAAADEQVTDSATKLEQGERRAALAKDLRTVNTRGDVAVARLAFDLPMNSVPKDQKDAVRDAAASLTAQGVTVDFSQDIVQDINFAGPSEIIGLAVAGLVLLVMLGSLLAAGLPLVIALVGVGVGLLGAVTLTHWVTMNDVTPVLALMLGLAVGIDYALFIVHRHRRQLAHGAELEDSIGRATGTAGSAVLFAGLTVVVALAALTLTGIPFLGTMGLVAAATVAVSVLVALTLAPALLRLMGQRVLSRRARRALLAADAADEAEAQAEDADDRATTTPAEDRGRGWGGVVTRHPWVTLLATTIALAVLAIPAASLKLGLPDGGSEAADSTAYRTYSTVAREFGPGQNAAVLAVAKVTPESAARLTDSSVVDLQLNVAERLAATEGIRSVVPIGASDDRRTLAFQIVPTTGPSDDATVELVHTLRDERDRVVALTGIDSIAFSGQTVANIDISARLADALPVYLAVVVGISLVLLLLVFRSLLVPLLATAGFLLSVAAAFGSVVAVYQWGWLGSVFGVERPGLVLSFLPTLVIGILFGLAMDYQMFMVSGMREAWAHGHTARASVRLGFHQGARVVTAAALIMASVFGSFVHAHMTMVRPIGFALAIGVLIDAFLVRMTAMPAVMHLLGERAWYLPAWMQQALPDLDVEGTSLEPADTDLPRAGAARPEVAAV